MPLRISIRNGGSSALEAREMLPKAAGEKDKGMKGLGFEQQ
jgi:hypothetical protein